MYLGIRAHGGVKSMGIMYSIYFVILFICGNYILLNVFLAIAVDNLADADSLNDDKDKEDQANKEAELQAQANAKPAEEGGEGANKETAEATPLTPDGGVTFGGEKPPIQKSQQETVVQFDDYDDDEYIYDDDDEIDEGDEEGKDGEITALPRRLTELNLKRRTRPIPPFTSFFVFKPDNRFRVFCHFVCNHSYFTNCILACILVSSAMLAAEDPLNVDVARNTILNYFDYFFTAVFTIEIFLKVIAYGVFLHRGSFLRSAFNILDLVVVCVSWISFLLESEGMSVVKVLRVLRVMRPLRAINRAKGDFFQKTNF